MSAAKDRLTAAEAALATLEGPGQAVAMANRKHMTMKNHAAIIGATEADIDAARKEHAARLADHDIHSRAIHQGTGVPLQALIHAAAQEVIDARAAVKAEEG